MTHRLAALILGLLLVPAGASAKVLVSEQIMKGQGENQIILYQAEQEVPSEQPDEALLKAGKLLEERFSQQKSLMLLERANARGGNFLLNQWPGMASYQNEKLFSAGRIWYGEQEEGGEGCTAAGLTLDLETGEEILFDQLFTDADAAAARMEAIMEEDILADMSGYMEAADLLPMPRDCFSVNQLGLSVYYQDDAYRNFDGVSGMVTFYWHELEAFIGEESPVYALSRRSAPDAQAIKNAGGHFDQHETLAVGKMLGEAAALYPLSEDPDFTPVSMLFVAQRPDMRGFAVEIPRYADTEEEKTPITAVRHSRIDWHGLTTGLTTRDEALALLGEADDTVFYDEDDAADMLLEPGESLVYPMEGFVLEAHFDENGVLSCVILRDAMPQDLY